MIIKFDYLIICINFVVFDFLLLEIDLEMDLIIFLLKNRLVLSPLSIKLFLSINLNKGKTILELFLRHCFIPSICVSACLCSFSSSECF